MILQSFYAISKVEPRDHLHKITPRAVLYLVAKKDKINGPIEKQRETFARANEPKQFVELEDLHIKNYKGELFDSNVKGQIDFLKKYV